MRAPTLLLALLFANVASAAPYAAGDSMEPLSLEDQHDEAHSLDGSVEVVLFSRDMEGGDLLEEALADTPKGFLGEKHALYVADIHGMPSFVARMFAIPSMRKRPYSMLLDRTGEVTARFPSEEGKATLLFLDDLGIERVFYAASPNQIREALGLPQQVKAD